MSVNEKMTAIADAIRGFTGGKDKLGLDAMAAAIPDVYEAGEKAEAVKCAAKHYVSRVVGDGTGTLAFDIPFEPDCLTVSSFDPFAITKADRMIFATRDFKSFGRLAGMGAYCRTESGAATLLLFTQSSAAQKFVIENGVCTVQNLGTSSTTGNELVFTDGEEYLICAVKYTDKTDKEYISEYILSLPDTGGMIEISVLKKESAFTEAEWQTLIAEKPGWNFSLV